MFEFQASTYTVQMLDLFSVGITTPNGNHEDEDTHMKSGSVIVLKYGPDPDRLLWRHAAIVHIVVS